jgi:hypothetical protein
MEEHIGLCSVSFDCPEFQNKNEQYETLKVVVSPIRLIYTPNFEGRNRDEWVIFQGCNMYKSCQSLKCSYSEAYRVQAREHRIARPPESTT